MSLSEGKMFTIEALNRIEGFVWPEGATHANVFNATRLVRFYEGAPIYVNGVVDNNLRVSAAIHDVHPDWRNSLITREEFESVDGWVRSWVTSVPENIPPSGIEVECGKFGRKWRYRKPQKQEVKPEPESIETMIRRYKDAGENKRAAIDKLNQAQADVEQAEALEDSLFMAIEAWAESHGFDIRVLSESEEKPELVITDWRDLQIGDVIWWSGDSDNPEGECEVCDLEGDDYNHDVPICVFTRDGGSEWIDTALEQWKFIRRPEKK